MDSKINSRISPGAYLDRRKRSGLESLIRSFREKMIIHQLSLLNVSNVLEIGAADCRLTNLIADMFPDISITAVDRSHQLISHGSTGVEKRLVADARFLPFKSDSFDAIVMVSTMKHISSIGNAIAEWRRVLRKNGCLIIIEPALWLLKLGAKLKYFDSRGIYNAWSVKQTKNELEKLGYKFLRGGYFDLISQSSLPQKLLVKILNLVRFNRFMLYQFVVVRLPID